MSESLSTVEGRRELLKRLNKELAPVKDEVEGDNMANLSKTTHTA